MKTKKSHNSLTFITICLTTICVLKTAMSKRTFFCFSAAFICNVWRACKLYRMEFPSKTVTHNFHCCWRRKFTIKSLLCVTPYLYTVDSDMQLSNTKTDVDNLQILTVPTNTREPGSSVGIATAYGLDGPGIEPRWGRDFPHLSRPALRPTQSPVQRVPGLYRG